MIGGVRMGHLLGKACIFLSILMFGFILGIIYQNEGFALYQSNFDVIEEELDENDEEIDVQEQDTAKFTLKQKESNIIDMEDENGVVIYEGKGGDHEFHQSIAHEPSSYNGERNNLLFSEMGERTAGVFESVFQSLFSAME